MLNIRLNISDQWPLLASHWRHIRSWGLPQNNAKEGKGEYMGKKWQKNVIFQTELSGRQISGYSLRDLMEERPIHDGRFSPGQNSKWKDHRPAAYAVCDKSGGSKVERCITGVTEIIYEQIMPNKKQRKNIISFLLLLFF